MKLLPPFLVPHYNTPLIIAASLLSPSCEQSKMASLLFKDMKRKSFSCASPAAAAICTSIDRKSIFLPTTRSTPHHQRDLQKQKSYYPSSNNKPKSQNLSCSKNQSEKLIDLISPVDSSRHLLSSSRYLSDDSAFIDIFPHDSTPVSTLIPIDSSKFRAKREDDKVILRSSSTRSQDQVQITAPFSSSM